MLEKLSKIVETDKGVYINGFKIPYVESGSIMVKRDKVAEVTLTILASEYSYIPGYEDKENQGSRGNCGKML